MKKNVNTQSMIISLWQVSVEIGEVHQQNAREKLERKPQTAVVPVLRAGKEAPKA